MWRVIPINDEEFYIVGPEHDVESDFYDFICTVNGNWSSETGELESPANAHLIASAPDLLAALEAVEWEEMPDGFGGSESICPWCGGSPLDDEEKAAGLTEHKPDCQRQAAIAAAGYRSVNEGL